MKSKTITTSNYDRFKLNNQNRPINQTHVRLLMNSIKKYGLLVPIHCDYDNNIIDGQHRYAACKHLKHPLIISYRDSYDINRVVELNRVHKKWSVTDYAHHYASKGIEAYATFLEICKEYPTLPRTKIYNALNLSKLDIRTYRTGALTIPDLDKSRKLLDLMQEASKYHMMSSPHYKALVAYVLEGYSIEDLIKNLRLVPDTLRIERPRRVVDALRVWEDIYNYKKRHKIKL